jgi:hypothetical protein
MKRLAAPLLGALLCLALIYPGAALSALLQPGDLEYVGAFRLPGASGGSSWEWSGGGLAYFPDGDPGGAGDGFPGSLFGIGHDWHNFVSEISIPAPIISAAKDPGQLNTAATLQPFADPRGGQAIPGDEYDFIRGDVAYLPARGGQSSGKLYTTWGKHYNYERVVTHGWCNTDLSNPEAAGLWYVGPHRIHSEVNDYLCPIPQDWAGANLGGMELATGRFRDGGLAGMGPALYAFAPWQRGNPPPPGADLPYMTLLQYSIDFDNTDPGQILNDYSHADEWSGAVWLSAGDRAAMVFVGTKGLGDTWYGYQNGTRHDDCQPNCPDSLGERGWWSSEARARFIFYNPEDLAAVARGERPAHSPQPYAYLDVDQYLYRSNYINEWSRLGAAAFDRERGLLYVFERRGDGENSLVHVWRVN